MINDNHVLRRIFFLTNWK